MCVRQLVCNIPYLHFISVADLPRLHAYRCAHLSPRYIPNKSSHRFLTVSSAVCLWSRLQMAAGSILSIHHIHEAVVFS